MQGNQYRNIAIVLLAALVVCILLFAGYVLTNNNSTAPVSVPTTNPVEPVEPDKKQNAITIDNAINCSPTESDKQQITDIQSQIGKTWENYSTEYCNIVLGSNASTLENSTSLTKLYEEAEKAINHQFMEASLNSALLDYATTNPTRGIPSLLEIPKNHMFENIPHFESDVTLVTIREFKSLQADFNKRHKYQGENSAEYTFHPKDKTTIDRLDEVLNNVHNVGFSQYVLVFQEVRVTSVTYNNETEKNEELPRRDVSGYDTNPPYYLVVTLYGKLGNTWYPIPLSYTNLGY